MPTELIPLRVGQHAVVLLPKATTDLPFFYFTKQKTRLNQNINYQGVDLQGRPMRWQVFPNNNPAIGAPGIDAHEAWMRLVKPTFDEYAAQGISLDILPLGRLRESLRKVGWGEGGWEARRLLRALHQIGAASCVADIWIPTASVDEEGEATFQHINATFSKLTLYAIGSKHLTEEQLHDGQFDFSFDLDDTLYVQLNPVEIQIQKNQPQRLIDNKYLFSVKPAGRRWYELVAPKIFGVVKNEGQYCEIRYSWYIEHHHTLKRYYERYRVVFQMNRLIRDHIDRGYISKVEYRSIKEPGQEIDWIIRYYPGEGARISIHRILAHQFNKPSPKQERRVSVKSPSEESKKNLTPLGQGIDQGLFAELVKRGVSDSQSRKLLLGIEQDQQISDQLEWGDQLIAQAPSGKFYNPPGLYIQLIKDNVTPPPTFESSRKRKLRLEAEQAERNDQQERARLQLAYEEYKKREIDNYIAANYDEYIRYAESKKQEFLEKHKSMSFWDENTLARLAETGARAEIAKRTPVDTFEAFSREQIRSIPSPADQDDVTNDEFLTV